MIGASLLLVLLVPAEGKPTPKFPLSKETTYVTGPLDKDGYIDYETALNERLSKGITPEKNANVLIWKALGPRPEGGADMPDEFFKWLDIDRPPDKGEYFIGLSNYLREHDQLDNKPLIARLTEQMWAQQRPWTAKDYPHFADWLKANKKPLALLIEATKRPEYFYPLVTRKSAKGSSPVIGALLPSVQKCRDVANALAMRAMLRLNDRQFDEAWQDLLACHRFGRLVGRGGTSIEALVGFAIEAIAVNADLAYLERAELTAKQAQASLKGLQDLPPMPPFADKIDLGERFTFLGYLQLLRRGSLDIETFSGVSLPENADSLDEKARAAIDWDLALRNGNRCYDRLAAASRLKDRLKRDAEFARISVELDRKVRTQAASRTEALKALLLGKDVGKEVGEQIGDVWCGLVVGSIHKLQNSRDRIERLQRNLQVAFALVAYQRDQGRYPEKLDGLTPKYLAPVPGDLFSGKPLVYRLEEKGYLLYSVGINGKDDGGRWMDDNPPGDDLRVRMPLPLLKEKK